MKDTAVEFYHIFILDPYAFFELRWFIIAFLIVILVGYALLMDVRRFLTVVGLSFVFQLMWEMISVGTDFPFFSLEYTVPKEAGLYLTIVPVTAIILKSLFYSVGAYVTVSMVTRKVIDAKIDATRDGGKKVWQHLFSGGLASVILTVSLMAVEPTLVSGNEWILGEFETFASGPKYFGVEWLYFVGVLLSSSITFATIALIESLIGFNKREATMFNYEKDAQSSFKYQQFGFFAFFSSIIIPSFFTFFYNPSIATVNFILLIPLLIILLITFSKWSDSIDDMRLSRFCDDNPDSFVCRWSR